MLWRSSLCITSFRLVSRRTLDYAISGCHRDGERTWWTDVKSEIDLDGVQDVLKRFTFLVTFYDVFVIRFSFILKDSTITISCSRWVGSIGANSVFQCFLDGRHMCRLQNRSDEQSWINEDNWKWSKINLKNNCLNFEHSSSLRDL